MLLESYNSSDWEMREQKRGAQNDPVGGDNAHDFELMTCRSLSPMHFENGDWNTGGTCDTIRFDLGKQGSGARGDPTAESAVAGTRVRLLNITALSMLRGEAHVSKYGPYPKLKGVQDCLHWCLPGVPDTWNEIFLAELATTWCERTR